MAVGGNVSQRLKCPVLPPLAPRGVHIPMLLGPLMNRVLAMSLVMVALVAAGCFVPFGNLGNDQFPLPSVAATYARGSATIDITQAGVTQTINLTRIGPGSTLNTLSGAGVWWRSDDGWGLLLTTYDTSLMFGQSPAPSGSASPGSTTAPVPGDLTIQLVADHEYWTASNFSMSGNRCIVDLAEASAERVSGSATCRGLRWIYGAAPIQFDTGAVYVDGEEPFDAEVTFEATP